MNGQDMGRAKNDVYCPRCEHKTYTAIRYGDIGVHCKFCGLDFTIVIRSDECILENDKN